MIKKTAKAAVLLLILALTSCRSTGSKLGEYNELSLVFAGDIMAHTGNFIMNDYSLIWEDLSLITSAADFSFANLEAPVDDDEPFQNYPNFNMQYSYPQAAINAGFNVFSLANNHTNDQLLKGILSTQKWADTVKKETENSHRPVYFSGLKENARTKKLKDQNVSYQIISKNGLTFIYMAVTQLLNTQIAADYINYFPNTAVKKKELTDLIKKIRLENPCDFFVLGLHEDDPEYVLEISEYRKNFSYELLDAGVDILWCNHPHVVRPIEYIKDRTTGNTRKIIMYSMGNTISSQRYNPQFKAPDDMREYTGDGILLGVKAKKDLQGIYFPDDQITYFTVYLDTDKNTVIRRLEDNFFKELESEKKQEWLTYLKKRKELLLELKEITTWQ